MTFRKQLYCDIKAEWEDAISAGRKTVDVRVNAPPYADVNTGDIIQYRFSRVRVIGVRSYSGLPDLLAREGFSNVVPEAGSMQEAEGKLLDEIRYIQPTHGILALELESLSGR